MPMPNKMPKFFDKHKICIICEGNEEYQYLKRLKDLKVWNEQYDISLVNAGGNGNIPARYQDRYQNGADEFTYREKWLLLTRMITLVENNFNLCELGPRSTGKSHLYKEISPNSILISGGQTTVANLFTIWDAKRSDWSAYGTV